MQGSFFLRQVACLLLPFLCLTLANSQADAQLGGFASGFSDIEAGLTGVSNLGGAKSSAVWADFNNDGRLDLYYGGTSNGAAATRRLYLQNVGGSFSLAATNLPAVFNPILAAGDFDHDGYADLYLSGDTSGSGDFVSRIYHNNQNLTFTDVNAGLPAAWVSADWADYDSDGDLDLLHGGNPEIYRNNAGVFSSINAGLPTGSGAVSWVDFDGDGDLDISLSISSEFSSQFAIYRNNGSGSFSNANASVQALASSNLEWGDYEGDGDLDLLHTGFNEQLFFNEGYIYLNDGQGNLSLLTAGVGGYYGWLDIDADGYLDFYSPHGVHFNSYPEENDFNTSNPLPGTSNNNSTRIWADYDGDGDYDFFTSYTDTFDLAYAQIYRFSPLLFGWVTDSEYTGIAGVVVNGGNLGTQTTDSEGYYAFSSLTRNSAFTLTPTLSGYAFSPPSISDNLGNLFQANFIASPAHTIAGTVKIGQSPLAGVTVNANSLGTSVTNASGEFSFPGVPHGTNYLVTPTLAGYSFTPANASGVLNGDIEINFAADACPDDTEKLVPGLCGCSMVDDTTDSDGDGLANCVDTDDDDDQVNDEQEIIDDTDPLDPGSYLPRLTPRVCSEWNSFLGMWNVLENMNTGEQNLKIETQLSRSDGTTGNTSIFSTAPQGQRDILVHDLDGWQSHNYGSVCSSIKSGEPNSFAGRMVYYKPDEESDEQRFEFAFSIPFTSGRRGTQWVSWNTFQPSLNPDDSSNLVANWLTLRNLEQGSQGGVLKVFDMQGDLLSSLSLNLSGGQRFDLGLHELGASLVGAVRWQPTRNDALFALYNARYFYDSASFGNKFSAATLIEGQSPSGQALSAPFNANPSPSSESTNVSVITEIVNSLDQTQDVTYRLFDQQGEELSAQLIRIPAHGSRHVIAEPNQVSLIGMIIVQGQQPGGVVATVLHYGRNTSLGLSYASARILAEPIGRSFLASYNSFLHQLNTLQLSNTASESRLVEVTVRSHDGKVVWETKDALTLAPLATTSINLSTLIGADSYGSVEISADAQKSVIGSIVREGNSYLFAIPLSPVTRGEAEIFGASRNP